MIDASNVRGVVASAVTVGAFAVVCTPSRASAQSVYLPRPDTYQYYWPGECLEAVARTEALLQRTGPDTSRFDIAGDTLPSLASTAARDCAASLSIMTVKPRDLILLARVYWAANTPALADSAVARRLATDAGKPVAARAQTLADLVAAYASARPARLALATAQSAALDRLTGDSDIARARLLAHYALTRAQYRRGDTAAVTREANAMIAAGKVMTADDRLDLAGSLLAAYLYLFDIAGMQTGIAPGPRAVLARARADIGSYPAVAPTLSARTPIAGLYGAPASKIRARYWSGAVGDTVRPAVGKLSLVIFSASRDNAPALRRLAARGLDITLVVGTRGHFQGRGPLEADSEAVMLQRHYSRDLGVPGTVAITASDYDRMFDGRRVRRPSENETAYAVRSGVWGVLVDRHGIIRRVYGRWMPWTERQIEEAIQVIK